ncbi:hypothetical protein PG989_001829 [Apiospora arundinis]
MEPIAIVGLSFRLPQGAENEDSLWDILEAGKNVMTEWPESRANLDAFYSPKPSVHNALSSRGGYFLKEDPAAFDAPFFSITPKEAASMDPQQRWMLEATYRALENAGIPVEKAAGTSTAVFAASMADDYAKLTYKDPDEVPTHVKTGLGSFMLANRLSWFFDLKGPSIQINTACSSSLVATDLACQSLRSGQSPMAIVAGSNVALTPEEHMELEKLSLLSPDSQCYSFDRRANGYSRGEGVLVLVLKTLKNAIQDGDMIRAVIRASGSNQDGHTPGLTQPSADSQEDLIRSVYKSCSLDFGLTRYIEAHGTGTQLGDSVEAKTIGRVFRTYRSPKEPLYIGSVKTNVGHLEGASGIVGILKSVMILERGIIPPNALFEKWNAKINAKFNNLCVPTSCIPWPAAGLRRISVNNFGLGGSNSHIILDDAFHTLETIGSKRLVHTSDSLQRFALCHLDSESVGVANGHNTVKELCGLDAEVNSTKEENGLPSIEFEPSLSNSNQGLSVSQTYEPSGDTPKAWLLVWSAKDETALKRVLHDYDAFYAVAGQQRPGFDRFVESLAYTLSARRSLMPWRSFAVVDSHMHPDTAKILSSTCVRSSRNPGLAFVFTGQGAQYAHMGLDLLVYPTFHATMTRASAILQELGASWSLMDELKHTERINSPQMSQPLCTVLQIALVELLRWFGIVPDAVVGHSSGEIAAAYAIGALSLQSACKVAYHRGRLAQRLTVGAHTPGGMMSVSMAEADVDAYLAKVSLSPDITVSCINSPSNVTLSGPETAIEELHRHLEADQIFARIIKTGVAYHSPAMVPISEEYASCLGTLEPGASDHDGILMASSVTGHRVTATGLLNRQYWVDNLVSPVRFADALRYLAFAAPTVDGLKALSSFAEIGPHAALKRPINDTLTQAGKGKSPTYLAVLSKFESPVKTVLRLVGQLFVLGHLASASVTAANQQQATAQGIPFLVDAPSYPFNHSKLYWHESRLSRDWRLREVSPQPLLGVPVMDWNPLEPRWRKILRTTEIPWLQDHIIGEDILFPAAGSIIMGIEGVKTMLRTRYPVRGFRIKIATFLKPIVIRAEADNEVITHVRPLRETYEKSDLRFEVQIFAVTDGTWSLCFKSTIHVEEEEPLNGVVDDSQEIEVASQILVAEYARAKEVSVNHISKQYFYKRHRELGQKYGDAFSLADDIYWDGDKLVVANVNAGPPVEPYEGIVHPAVLDTAFQLCYAAPCNGMSGNLATTVPHRIREAWISATGWQYPNTSGIRMLTRSCLKGSGIGIESSVQVLSNDGSRLCHMAKLELMPIVGNHESDNDTRKLFHRIDWKPHLSLLSAEQLRDLCYACNNPSPGEDDSTIKDFHDLQTALRSVLRQKTGQMLQTDWTKAPRHMEEYVSLMQGELQKMQDEASDNMTETDLVTKIEALGVKRPAWKIFIQVVQDFLSFIRGDVSATELLTSSDLSRSFYEDLLGRFHNQTLMTYFHLAVHQAPPLRVLEIGAGSGAVTQLALSIFEHIERDTGGIAFSEYVFTDLSDSFSEIARQQFGEYKDRMAFRSLDIERDFADQGFSPASFDVVLVGGALYATRRLPSIVQDVRQVLKPGGHLVICDTAIPESFAMNFMLGLLPEFWIKTAEGHTGLAMTQAEWDIVLREGGFSGNDLVVRDDDDDIAHRATIIISTNPPLPQEGQEATKAWLIVREEDHYQNEVAKSLTRALTEMLQREPTTIPLTGLSGLHIATTDCVVFLAELGHPLLADVSASTLDWISWLVQQSNNLLWVASGDAGDDGCNANVYPQNGIKDGFLRTLRAEFANKRIVSLSLHEMSRDIASCARQISTVIDSSFKTSGLSELEYVIQDGHILTGRLVEDSHLNHELSSSISPETKSTSWLPGPPLKLAIQAKGQLETLHFIEDNDYYQGLGPTDVEIEAKSWAVNFRDVFGALGRLEEPYFGTDCAGVVTRVGDECTSVSPGDRVCMCVVDCMRMYPRATEANVVRIPASVSFEEACATINPAVTAWYSLMDVARLRRGEKILIHSAAGATGQLAIQVSQMVGAEVFATVGSDVKKQLLMDLYGIPADHVLYSRNNTFSQAIMRLTDGYGVDVVLNSLVGEGLRSSWECIAPYGRFIEIGKVDINANSSLPMASFASNATFAAVDVLHILLRRKDMASELLHKTMAMAFHGRLHHPRPLNIYDVGSVEDAFRYIQRGRNSGRVVISINPLTTVQKSLITRAASHAAAKAVRELREKNITILTPKCDVASLESLVGSLDDWGKSMPPIRGCINLAMVLNDAVFENMTHSQWIRTMDSKVATSWNLHTLLSGLDFMILFSSVSGIVGNPGQSNYAAGCTFQDNLAHWRTSHGWRTTAIDLGVVSDVGVVAETADLKRHLAEGAQGFGQVDAREILALLDICCDPTTAIGTCPPQIIMGLRTPADLLARSIEPPEILQRPLFAHFQHAPSSATSGSTATGSSSSPGALFRQAGTAEARTAVVVKMLTKRLARALAIEPGDVDADRPLHAFGVDSLVGVELRNWIAREFAANLPVFEIVGGRTVTSVAQLIEGCSQVNRRSE